MNDALKPCPFCGEELIPTQSGDGYTHNRSVRNANNCVFSWVVIRPPHHVAWNARVAAPVVAVKGLVWEDFEGAGAKASAFYQANYLITLWRGRGEFEVSLSYPGYQTGYDGHRFHNTLEAAKAAAQADYTARILSTMETAPADPLADERVVALVSEMKSVIFAYDVFRADQYEVGLAPLDDCIEDARAALAALSEPAP